MKPESIQQLAKTVRRDFKNVYKDIQLLADYGLIELKENGARRATTLSARYTEPEPGSGALSARCCNISPAGLFGIRRIFYTKLHLNQFIRLGTKVAFHTYMPRTLRIQSPNALYHCMNRGTDRCSIALLDSDFLIFTKTLAELHQAFGVEIFAFCLMTNHYHLLLRARQNNLSRAMRHFGHAYTQRFNKLHKRDGVLFRGRFRSLAVLEEDYILQVLRYIHLNPVEAQLVSNPANYPWSSHPSYLGHRSFPWLQTAEILSLFELWPGKIKTYEEFIADGNRSALKNFYNRQRLPAALCSDDVQKHLESQTEHYRPGT